MSLFDLLVLLILAVSGLIGWYRGGVRELVVLFAIAGGFLALHLFGAAMSAQAEGTLARLLVLAGVFLLGDLVTLALGTLLIRRFFGRSPKRSDRAAGALFGAVRGWVLAAAVVFTVEVYHTAAPQPGWLERSLFAAPLSATASSLLRNADVTARRL